MNTATFTHAALTALPRVRGLAVGHESATKGASIVTIRTAAGTDRYVDAAKRTVTSNGLPARLSHIEHLRKAHHEPPLLLSASVPPAIAPHLERHGSAYADAAGNAHLDGAAAYVHIQEHPPQRMPTRKGLTATDLTLVFAILCKPRLQRKPLRAIAATTGVSLGKVSTTAKTLDSLDLVRTRARNRTLHHPARRLQRWEIGYRETVKPRPTPTTWYLSRREAALAERPDPFAVDGRHRLARRAARHADSPMEPTERAHDRAMVHPRSSGRRRGG